jgi:hypothetical protein
VVRQSCLNTQNDSNLPAGLGVDFHEVEVIAFEQSYLLLYVPRRLRFLPANSSHSPSPHFSLCVVVVVFTMVVPVDSTGSDGIGRLILGLTWTFTGLAIIVVVARFIIRKRISKSWSADDWIMLLALVLQVVYQAEFTVLVSWGEGLPYDRLTAVQKITKSKWGYISAIPSILTSCIARISIAILLVRIFGVRRWIKWYLIIFTSLETILSILSIIFLVAQCTPWSGLWDHTIKAKCWDPFIYAYTALATQCKLGHPLPRLIVVLMGALLNCGVANMSIASP